MQWPANWNKSWLLEKDNCLRHLKRDLSLLSGKELGMDIKRALGKIHSIPVFVCTKLCFPCVSFLSLFLFNFGGKVLK